MLTRSSISTLLRDAVALTPSYLVPGIASLASVPILFAALGAGGYGLWALIYGIANGVPQVTTNWLESLILRFGHRPEHRIGSLIAAGAGLASAIGGAILAVVFIPGADARLVGATAVVTLGVGAYLIVVARLQSLLRFAAISRAATVRSLSAALLSIGGATLTGDPVVAALGMSAGFGIGALDGLRSARHDRHPPETGSMTLGEVTDLTVGQRDETIRYAVASGFFAVGQFVLAVGDRFVLSAFRPLADVGIYAATYSIADLAFRFGPSVVVTSVRQRLFRSWDRGDRQRAPEVFGIGLAGIAWMMAWLIVAVVLVGPRLRFLPIDWLLAGPIAAGLAGLVVANTLVIVYSAQVRQVRVAVHVVLAAIVNVALNLALAPIIGALGAALATALSYGLYLAVNVGGLRTFLGTPRRPAVAALLASLGVAFAATVLPATGPVPLYIAALGLLATTPLVVALATSVVSQRER